MLAYLGKGFGWNQTCAYADVAISTGHRWRKLDERFNADVRKLLASPVHQDRILNREGKRDIAVTDDPKMKFILNYRRTGNRNEALNVAGLNALELEDMVNPNCETYDSGFATMVKEEEARLLNDIEDDAKRSAARGDKTLQQFFLKALKKETYAPQTKSDNKVLNLFWFNDEGENKALKDITNVFASD